MDRKMKVCLAAVVALLLVGAVPAMAAEPEHTHLTGAWLDKFHNPMEGVTMGADVRLREKYGRNITSMNEQQGDVAGERFDNSWHRQRVRTRWWTKVDLASDMAFNMRLMWEWDNWDDPEWLDRRRARVAANPGPGGVDFDEAAFDIFNVTWKNAFDMPMSLVVGRQEIILGNGWLVLDGTPADGSRTIYFDAVRATYDFSDKTKADIIYIQNYDDEAKWLPPINNRSWRHVTQMQDEKGFIFYLTDKSLIPDTQLEAYYIYKQDKASDWWKSRFARTRTKAAGAALYDEIHTIGMAVSGQITENLGYRSEFAKQFGKKGFQSQSAFGTDNRLTYKFHDERNSSLHLDYEFMTGDDPGSNQDEAFDPLWGEWPQYSRGGDLPAYLWACEQDLGEVTNLHRLGIGYTFDICPKWSLQTDYNLMWADENMKGMASAPFGTTFGTGNFRGQMITGYLKWKCCKQLSMHWLIDYFQPGSYFDGSTQDHAMFLRWNMEYVF